MSDKLHIKELHAAQQAELMLIEQRAKVLKSAIADYKRIGNIAANFPDNYQDGWKYKSYYHNGVNKLEAELQQLRIEWSTLNKYIKSAQADNYYSTGEHINA